MITFAEQLKAVKAHPRFNSSIFQEFEQFASAFSDDEFLNLFTPALCLPNMADQVEKGMELQELATNSWLMSHKPKFIIDMRLRLFNASIEGQLKLIFELMSDWLAKVHSTPKRANSNLGTIFKHIQGNSNKLTPESQKYIHNFSHIVDLRNAIAHNSYIICIETKKIKPAQLISAVQSSLSPKAKQIFQATLDSTQADRLAETLNITAKLGKFLGFKSDISVFDEVDNAKSNVVYENYPPGKWQPISKNSPTISLADLTKNLNSFDEFSFCAYFGLMSDFTKRFNSGIYLERFCTCKSPSYIMAGSATYTCWYCQSSNAV